MTSWHRRIPVLSAVVALGVAGLPLLAAPTGASTLPATHSAATPLVQVNRAVAPPTGPVTVTATGFAAKTAVTIRFDNTTWAQGTTTATGGYVAVGAVPSSALPGPHTFTASAGSGRASTPIKVYTNWSSPRMGPANRGYNPHENIISRAAVTQLTLKAQGPSGYDSNTPALVNGVLYFADYSEGVLAAMNATTDQIIWADPQLSGQTMAVYVGGPVVVGTVLYTATSDGAAQAYDTATGKRLWTVGAGNGEYADGPTVVNGVVYIQGDTNFDAFDAATGAILWQVPSTGLLSTPAVVNGVVYRSGSSSASALDAKTGATLWSQPLSTNNTEPTYANGKIYLGDDGNEVCLDATTGKLLWSTVASTTSGATDAPTVGPNAVYQIFEDDLVAFDPDTGAILWDDRNLVNTQSVIPTDADGVVYASQGHNFYAINDTTGAVLSTVGNVELTGNAVIANGNIYVGSADSVDTFTVPASPT